LSLHQRKGGTSNQCTKQHLILPSFHKIAGDSVFAWLNFLTNNPELDCYCILAPFAIAHPIILVNPFANSPAPIGLKFYARSTDIRGNSAELSTIERRFCSSPAAMRHSWRIRTISSYGVASVVVQTVGTNHIGLANRALTAAK
jgi:hypothetical protein